MKIITSGPSLHRNRVRMETVTDFIFLGSKITADHDWSHEIERSLFLQRKAMANLSSIWKSRDITTPTKAHIVSYGFPSSPVWMGELDHKEDRVFKSRCFWTVVLEKTFEGPLDSKGIKPVNPKGNQPWIFIGRTDAEAKVPTLWPSDAKSWLIGKTTLMLKKIKGRRSGWQRLRLLDDITDSMDMNLRKFWSRIKDRKASHAAVDEAPYGEPNDPTLLGSPSSVIFILN